MASSIQQMRTSDSSQVSTPLRRASSDNLSLSTVATSVESFSPELSKEQVEDIRIELTRTTSANSLPERFRTHNIAALTSQPVTRANTLTDDVEPPILPPVADFFTVDSDNEPGPQIAQWRAACISPIHKYLSHLPYPTLATAAERETIRNKYIDALCEADPQVWPGLFAAYYGVYPSDLPDRDDEADWGSAVATTSPTYPTPSPAQPTTNSSTTPTALPQPEKSLRQKRIAQAWASPPRVLVRQQTVFGPLALGENVTWGEKSATASTTLQRTGSGTSQSSESNGGSSGSGSWWRLLVGSKAKDDERVGPRGEDEYGVGFAECRCTTCRVRDGTAKRVKVMGLFGKGRKRAGTVSGKEEEVEEKGEGRFGARLRSVKTNA